MDGGEKSQEEGRRKEREGGMVLPFAPRVTIKILGPVVESAETVLDRQAKPRYCHFHFIAIRINRWRFPEGF